MGQVTRTNYGLTRRLRFTNAEVIAWPTSRLQLLSAVGIQQKGQLWLAQFLFLVVDAPTGSGGPLAYGNVNADAEITLQIDDGSCRDALSFPLEPQAILVTGEATGRVITGHVGGIDATAKSLFLALNNQGSGNLTGGSVSQYLDLQLMYSEWTRHPEEP